MGEIANCVYRKLEMPELGCSVQPQLRCSLLMSCQCSESLSWYCSLYTISFVSASTESVMREKNNASCTVISLRIMTIAVRVELRATDLPQRSSSVHVASCVRNPVQVICSEWIIQWITASINFRMGPNFYRYITHIDEFAMCTIKRILQMCVIKMHWYVATYDL